MISAAQAELAADRAALRRALADRGFADDGEVLRGPVPWQANSSPVTATVDITLPARYPFGPPAVRLHDPGAPLEITFHIDLDGCLCLWDTDEPASEPPWKDPNLLLQRIAGWLEQTAAGWPGDEDCDLDRYLAAGAEPSLVLYNYDTIRPAEGYHYTTASRNPDTIAIKTTTWDQPVRTARTSPGKGKKARKRQAISVPRQLAYVADLGILRQPVREWDDVAALLGDRARELRRYINQGHMKLLLLWYRRGRNEGALALAVERGQPPDIRALQAADTSLPARTLRAGTHAGELCRRRLTIVGCGAIGSHIADLLYREGVRRLHLIDSQILRPGNVIRHIALPHLVGYPKVEAVRLSLALYELGDDEIQASQLSITSPEQALQILSDADLVIDATGNQQASAILCWAAGISRRPMITVCVQREGGIARADRFPLRGSETHLPPVPAPAGKSPIRERGCGDAVSLTPPSAVVAAAELAAGLARDELALRCTLPATLIRVLQEQPDHPYDRLATITSPPRPEPGARP